MWASPGKKLIFMGDDIGQQREWNHDGEVDWGALADPAHLGIQRMVRDLNLAYAEHAALHRRDAEPDGFAWLVGDDRANSVFAFLRRADDAPPVLAVMNMTPVPRAGYRIGVPLPGLWREILNSDSSCYGGSGVGNFGGAQTHAVPSHGHAQSLDLTLAPLSTMLFLHDGTNHDNG
jgi:1,4-alpha-glucan branching enzyme